MEKAIPGSLVVNSNVAPSTTQATRLSRDGSDKALSVALIFFPLAATVFRGFATDLFYVALSVGLLVLCLAAFKVVGDTTMENLVAVLKLVLVCVSCSHWMAPLHMPNASAVREPLDQNLRIGDNPLLLSRSAAAQMNSRIEPGRRLHTVSPIHVNSIKRQIR